MTFSTGIAPRSLIHLLLSFFFYSTFTATVADASSFSPLQPPSYPLSVRTPFLQAWLPVTSSNQGLLPACEAQFWDGSALGWGTIIRVDNVSYTIFGDLISTHAGQTVAQFTTTQSIFFLQAGPVNITADFFSPVSPNNHVRHSLPFSYYTLTVTPNDGNEHVVEFYNEIGVNWAGPSGALNWAYTQDDSGELVYYTITSQSDIPFTVNTGDNNMVDYGNTIFSTRLFSGLTNQSGQASSLRKSFTANGSLTGVQDLPVNGQGSIAFAHNLGVINDPQNITIVVGSYREKAINYLGNTRTPYFRSQYPDPTSALQAFYSDYNDALDEALELDQNITAEASLVSSNYSDILRLSVRQMFGGMEITIPYDTLNTNDVLSFLKEISTDGNVNTADVIFPMLPGLYIMAPNWIKYLIQPLLDYQMSGAWPMTTAVHDLGSLYPNATGHNNGKAEELPIESTGDMILLTYAYVLATNDTLFLHPYTPLFTRWASYLMTNTISSASQDATTDAAGPVANQTELAIKACIALAAYGTMFDSPAHIAAGKAYASELYEKVGTDKKKTHFTLTHGAFEKGNVSAEEGWTLGYNLFADALLGLSVFGQESFQMQSEWYPTVRDVAGVPLDTQVSWGKTDWNSWSAAISSPSTRAMFITDIHTYISNAQNSVPLSDRFWAGTSKAGQAAQGVKDRPTVGGHFAVMALERVRSGSWVMPTGGALASGGGRFGVGGGWGIWIWVWGLGWGIWWI